MRAYLMDDVPGDPRLPHDSDREASADVLTSIGVLSRHIPIDAAGRHTDVHEFARAREYKHHDVIAIDKASLGDTFEAKIEGFYCEHMHEDEEIRYVLDGSGYFDVREHATDAWIRCRVGAGDLLVLPAGIYHRFGLDMENHVQLMRLFKDEPKWIAHNRGEETDRNPLRIQYLESIAVQ